MLRYQWQVVAVVIDSLPLVLVFLEGGIGISIIDLKHQPVDGVSLQADFHVASSSG